MSLIAINLKVNGQWHQLAIEPHEMLLTVLRERLGLTGAKRSCDVQVCGTCTVLVDGAAVSSCTYLAYEANGRDVVTIEGLANGSKLHPIQRAFLERGGFQCGFCTPGFIMATYALLQENPNPDEETIREGLSGNLCRCTGYRKIVEAVKVAASWQRGEGQ